ncbi:MAG: hypothetical protein QMD46_11035 [Methanomicrobiales archaeon]|nr:hypothetical protein [Methanomicrobiales archaeon]MDI6877004.1 hypothetical protein [Methanomicrobiales archaeon]
MDNHAGYIATCRFCRSSRAVRKSVVDRCVRRIQTIPVDCEKCGRVTFYRGADHDRLIE